MQRLHEVVETACNEGKLVVVVEHDRGNGYTVVHSNDNDAARLVQLLDSARGLLQRYLGRDDQGVCSN